MVVVRGGGGGGGGPVKKNTLYICWPIFIKTPADALHSHRWVNVTAAVGVIFKQPLGLKKEKFIFCYKKNFTG